MEPTKSITPHPGNPRRDHDVDGIARSIAAFGWRQPLVVWDGDGHLLVGHGRLLAAQQLKQPKVPVHHVPADDMTPEQATAYRLADNRSAEGSAWDDKLLVAELRTLQQREQELSGFDEVYREELMMRTAALDAPENDIDREWIGMPACDNQDFKAFKTLVVHFADQDAVDRFFRLLEIDPKHVNRRFVHYPTLQLDEMVADKRWSAAQ